MKFQIGLSSLQGSCKRALRKLLSKIRPFEWAILNNLPKNFDEYGFSSALWRYWFWNIYLLHNFLCAYCDLGRLRTKKVHWVFEMLVASLTSFFLWGTGLHSLCLRTLIAICHLILPCVRCLLKMRFQMSAFIFSMQPFPDLSLGKYPTARKFRIVFYHWCSSGRWVCSNRRHLQFFIGRQCNNHSQNTWDKP